MASDSEELNAILAAVETPDSDEPSVERGPKLAADSHFPMKTTSGYCQWSSSDGKRFVPTSKTVGKLTPGVYDVLVSQEIGLYFERIPVITHGLLRFPETNSDKVVAEIQKFWRKEDVFREYKLTYKRGIILWGPPGSGKSCTIQLIIQDVVERGGVVIKFSNPSIFVEGIRRLREIQPDTPIVVLMEDIDSTLEIYNESEVLNILDGVNQIEKAVFLATTNHPEKLGSRIINRPSRFDKRFKIGHPNAESRRMYLEHIIGSKMVKDLHINLDQWVEDTDDFSIAHLKELFTAVVILGDDYDDAIKCLSSMREAKPTSSDDERRNSLGFTTSGSKPKKKTARLEWKPLNFPDQGNQV